MKIYKNFANIMKLNLGCSSDVKEEYVNIDICNPWGLDIIVHDLNKTPYPFEDNTFDEVYASHIIEHLNDFHKTIIELHRICKPHAKIIIKAPFFASTKYFGDPSHKIPFSYRTFDNYTIIEGKLPFYDKWRLKRRTNFGEESKFRMIKRKFIFSNFKILKWIGWFINLAPMYYERFFCFILPAEELYFELEVIK